MFNIDFNTLPEWLGIVIGFGTFGIAIGAMLYARHCEVKYSTAKSPFDLINLVAGMIGSAFIIIQSPYWYSIWIGIAALIFLAVRNWLIIKQPLPVVIMTLLTIGSFVNLVWFIAFRFLVYSKRN